MNQKRKPTPKDQPTPPPRAPRSRRASAPINESLFATNTSAQATHSLRIKARSSGDLADVFAAGEKFGPLSVSDLAALELTDGSAWTNELRARVELAVRRRACLRKAITLLAARPRSERELVDRLAAAGFEPGIIDPSLATLRAQGLVNDTTLAESIVETASRRGDAQPNIAQSFQRRGISPENEAISDAPKPNDESAATLLARALFTDRSRSAKPPNTPADALKARRKIYAALLRRGFDEDTADRAAATVVGPLADEAQGSDE